METKTKNWLFVCYTDYDFQQLKVIYNVAANGAITPGTTVPTPIHPRQNVATSIAVSNRHGEDLDRFHVYSAPWSSAKESLNVYTAKEAILMT